MTDQPTPPYTDEDLERVLARDFGDAAGYARKMLAGYGREGFQHEHLRVRMACLKLAEGSIERLAQQVASACKDYRDALACAEYPAYTSAHSAGQRQRAIESDWNQLQQWLRR